MLVVIAILLVKKNKNGNTPVEEKKPVKVEENKVEAEKEETIEKTDKFDNLKKMQSSPKLNLKYKFENEVGGDVERIYISASYYAFIDECRKPEEKYNNNK